MTHISIPLGLLLGPFKEKVEKSVLLETYAASHRKYLQRTGFLSCWKALGSYLEISIDTPSVLDSERVPAVSVAVRSKCDVVEELKLVVSSSSAGFVNQDVLEFRDVGQMPVVRSAHSLPLRTFVIAGPSSIIQSIDNINVSLVSFKAKTLIQDLPVTSIKNRVNVIDLLNERFVEKWGSYWNVAAIDFAVKEYGDKIRWRLVTLRHYRPPGQHVPFRERLVTSLKCYVGRPFAWIISRPLLLKAYFWLPIFFHVRKFDPDRG